ncbi:MAG: hypothetical protein LBV71_06030 [Prevotella sp.]|jgi:hypothetical protein|nr:hypothetical protein [Prevotella sp.]
MAFSTEDFTPLTPTPAGRKNIYFPNLTEVTITSNKENDKLELPLGLKFGMNFEEVLKTLGKPTLDRRNNPRYNVFGGCSWGNHIKRKSG